MERKYFWAYILIGGIALLTLISVGDSRVPGQEMDLELAAAESGRSFSFELEIDGQSGFYHECHGLGSSHHIEQVTVRTPQGPIVQQKTPGALEWHNITLRRTGPSGPTGAPVWSWRKAMEDGDLQRAVKNGRITLWGLNPVEPLARWDFRSGWVASLRFDGSVEEITIVHEGLVRMSGTDSTSPPATRAR